MLSAEEKNIYGALYDVVEENMRAAGKVFQPTKTSFILSADVEPQRTNLEILKNVRKDEILQAAYVTILRRFPDDETVKYWNQPTIFQQDNYNRTVLKSVANSIERSVKKIDLYNEEMVGFKLFRLVRLRVTLLPALNFVYKIYRLLPSPFRKTLKKILHRG